MEEITIQISDKYKKQTLLNFLKTLDFVENIRSAELPLTSATETHKDEDFFALAGLWKDRDITLDSIRKEAWAQRV